MRREKYLCEIFRRKCRVPSVVEKEFVGHGFVWKVLDKNLLMFESSKDRNARLRTTVRSHCSLFDQIYSPAIRRFDEFLKSSGRGNYSLFIYDGELLPGPQLEEIVKSHSEDVIILHHQEFAALIDSDFTVLGAVNLKGHHECNQDSMFLWSGMKSDCPVRFQTVLTGRNQLWIAAS